MTTERSGMSLEQVRAELYEYWADADSSNTKRGYKRLIDAIDAHLSRDAVVSDEDVRHACETFDPVGWKVMEGDARADFKESVRRMLESFAARPAAVPDGIPDELKQLSESATPGEWRSMRDGNQYLGTSYMPTAKLVGASRVIGPKRPWNPHSAIAFGIRAEAQETVRFTDEDADFVCGAVNWVRAMLAQWDGGK